MITIKTGHYLTVEQATMKSKALINKLSLEHKNKYSHLTEKWEGNNCDYEVIVKGQKISGRLKILSDSLLLDIRLTWPLIIFKNKIKNEVEGILYKCFNNM